ncbi:hypothetical protein BGZ76_007032 [Entomortierella beljakovae]|nr:hypothetical protein BGZ76_007032 [Entomortierella beljakovae]
MQISCSKRKGFEEDASIAKDATKNPKRIKRINPTPLKKTNGQPNTQRKPGTLTQEKNPGTPHAKKNQNQNSSPTKPKVRINNQAQSKTNSHKQQASKTLDNKSGVTKKAEILKVLAINGKANLPNLKNSTPRSISSTKVPNSSDSSSSSDFSDSSSDTDSTSDDSTSDDSTDTSSDSSDSDSDSDSNSKAPINNVTVKKTPPGSGTVVTQSRNQRRKHAKAAAAAAAAAVVATVAAGSAPTANQTQEGNKGKKISPKNNEKPQPSSDLPDKPPSQPAPKIVMTTVELEDSAFSIKPNPTKRVTRSSQKAARTSQSDYPKNSSEVKNAAKNDDKRSTEEDMNAPETPPRNYEELPKLEGYPKVGDLIAYKTLEIDSSYNPIVSDFKEATITSYSESDKMAEAQLDPKFRVIFELNSKGEAILGKFDIYNEEEMKRIKNGIVTLDMLSLADCRIIALK